MPIVWNITVCYLLIIPTGWLLPVRHHVGCLRLSKASNVYSAETPRRPEINGTMALGGGKLTKLWHGSRVDTGLWTKTGEKRLQKAIPEIIETVTYRINRNSRNRKTKHIHIGSFLYTAVLKCTLKYKEFKMSIFLRQMSMTPSVSLNYRLPWLGLCIMLKCNFKIKFHPLWSQLTENRKHDSR